MGQFD